MKILLVNYRYFISGGPEKYLFNIKDRFEREGHEVIPFSIKADKNVESEYSDYFVSPIGGEDQVYFEDYKKTPKTVWQMISRSVYSFGVKRAIKKIIRETRPDVVYILHFVNKLSPSVITGAKQMGCRVVLRLSDYYLLCPRFDFMYEQRACEECMKSGYGACLKRRCVKGSLAASLIRVTAMRLHKLMGVYKGVDAFVCPSKFLKDKLVEYGFPADRVHQVLTFTSDSPYDTETVGEYGLYLGRITEEKGVESLIHAYQQLGEGYPLKVVADDSTPLAKKLHAFVEESGMKNITFTGFLSGDALHEAVAGARFMCVPSIWYENIPNTVLEAHAAGKPVICSRLGSLTELIEDDQNGYLFEPDDAESIAECVRRLDDDETVRRLARGARASFEKKYTGDRHYEELMDILSPKERD